MYILTGGGVCDVDVDVDVVTVDIGAVEEVYCLL
jgi:hypothetical protein